MFSPALTKIFTPLFHEFIYHFSGSLFIGDAFLTRKMWFWKECVCVCLQEMTAYKKRPKGGAPMGQALAKKQDSEDEEEEEEEEEIDEEDE